jgi:hypothetical protein
MLKVCRIAPVARQGSAEKSGMETQRFFEL